MNSSLSDRNLVSNCSSSLCLFLVAGASIMPAKTSAVLTLLSNEWKMPLLLLFDDLLKKHFSLAK